MLHYCASDEDGKGKKTKTKHASRGARPSTPLVTGAQVPHGARPSTPLATGAQVPPGARARLRAVEEKFECGNSKWLMRGTASVCFCRAVWQEVGGVVVPSYFLSALLGHVTCDRQQI